MGTLFSCSNVARLLLLLSIPATLMLMDPVAAQPSPSHDHHPHRRSPMGFEGVRGKRSTENEAFLNLPTQPSADEELATDADASAVASLPSGAPGMMVTETGKPLSHLQRYLGESPTRSLSKRASSRGFVGMRGKKDFELVEDTLPLDQDKVEDEDESVNENNSLEVNEQNSQGLNRIKVSKPTYFVQKNPTPRSSPLMGMRGKKRSGQLDEKFRAIKVFKPTYVIKENPTPKPDPNSDIMIIGKLLEDGTENGFGNRRFGRQVFSSGVKKNIKTQNSDGSDQELPFGGNFRSQAYLWDTNAYRALLNELRERQEKYPLSEHDIDFLDDNDQEDSAELEEPRNKKLFFNLPYRFIPKRGPSGFMGMRGKKLVTSFKRGPSGFMGMRGKKSYPSDPLIELLLHKYDYPQLDDQEALDGFDALEKRAPANGFVGMRGKKWNAYDTGNEMDKRAPAMGFHGMRGKKESSLYNGYSRYDEINGAKRSPKMGFHGMRGKRSVSGTGSQQLKRTPYEFRGKFVGVRGKKHSLATASARNS